MNTCFACRESGEEEDLCAVVYYAMGGDRSGSYFMETVSECCGCVVPHATTQCHLLSKLVIVLLSLQTWLPAGPNQERPLEGEDRGAGRDRRVPQRRSGELCVTVVDEKTVQ